MDQSDARHLLQRLPVIDCMDDALGADLIAYAQAATRQPTAASQAAAILAAHAPRPPAPMPADLRPQLCALTGRQPDLIGPPAPLAHRRAQARLALQSAEWAHTDRRLRAALTNWAGLRAHHPNKTMHELAARAWGDIPAQERAELCSAVRVLQRLLGRLPHIAADRS